MRQERTFGRGGSMAALLLALGAGMAPPAANALSAQAPSPPVGLEAIEALTFPPLDYAPPEADTHHLLGVPVFHLEDRTFPLVDLFIQIRGGVNHVVREDALAMTALSSLLRTGGSGTLPADSIELRFDLMAAQLSMGSGGGGSFAGLNLLSQTLAEGLELLGTVLLEPRFDADAIALWQSQERDRLRRRIEDPGSLAFSEFNRLVFGDHPVGWVFTLDDLDGDALGPDRLRRLHARTHCRENLMVGVAGDVGWSDLAPQLEAFLSRWPSCAEVIPPSPLPTLRSGPGVWILPLPVEQTTLILAGLSPLRQEDSPQFFASRMAQLILGGGGFTSRLFQRIRTEQGLAYGASAVWTTPQRHDGLVGAVTATRPDRVAQTSALLLEILEDMATASPSAEELTLAMDQLLHGAVFAATTPGQVVSRMMGNRAQELPDNWPQRFLEGIQAVTADEVRDVVARNVPLDQMILLIVGDPGPDLDALPTLGPRYRLREDGTFVPWDEAQPDRAPRP
jgi:zinc protease